MFYLQIMNLCSNKHIYVSFCLINSISNPWMLDLLKYVILIFWIQLFNAYAPKDLLELLQTENWEIKWSGENKHKNWTHGDFYHELGVLASLDTGSPVKHWLASEVLETQSFRHHIESLGSTWLMIQYPKFWRETKYEGILTRNSHQSVDSHVSQSIQKAHMSKTLCWVRESI